MVLNEITRAALDAAAPALGSGPVTMVNLLCFRSEVVYTDAFARAQPDPRSALYNGYAVAFVEIAQELGVEGVEAVFIGHRAAPLVTAADDDWGDIVIVRYRSFADFRRIIESQQYAQRARPHHSAAVAKWRLTVTTE